MTEAGELQGLSDYSKFRPRVGNLVEPISKQKLQWGLGLELISRALMYTRSSVQAQVPQEKEAPTET